MPSCGAVAAEAVAAETREGADLRLPRRAFRSERICPVDERIARDDRLRYGAESSVCDGSIGSVPVAVSWGRDGRTEDACGAPRTCRVRVATRVDRVVSASSLRCPCRRMRLESDPRGARPPSRPTDRPETTRRRRAARATARPGPRLARRVGARARPRPQRRAHIFDKSNGHILFHLQISRTLRSRTQPVSDNL